MSDLERVIAALRAVQVTTEAEEEANERRRQAEIHLAEIVGTRRRDKDTGFEADHDARDLIVKAALAGELVPADKPIPPFAGGEQ